MKNHILKGPKFNTYEEALQFGLMYYKTSIVVEIAGTIYSKNVPAMYFVDGSATASILEVDHGVDFIFEDYDAAKYYCDPEQNVEKDNGEIVVGHTLANVD